MYFPALTIYLFSPWIEKKQISTFPENFNNTFLCVKYNVYR